MGTCLRLSTNKFTELTTYLSGQVHLKVGHGTNLTINSNLFKAMTGCGLLFAVKRIDKYHRSKVSSNPLKTERGNPFPKILSSKQKDFAVRL